MKLTWYIGTSTAAAVAVIASAFHQRANFYSAMVYLAQSNFCLIILVNFVFMLYAGFFYALQRLCYGQLRPVETEQLYEKAWFAITETCLAMTIFRDEMGVSFLVMFSALITGKVWQWIGEGRVEILEQQSPPNPWLFHARLSGSLLAGIIYDSLLLRHAVHTVIRQARPNMMVMFLFEFAVLTTSSWHTAARYALNIAEHVIVRRQTRRRLEERRRQVARERDEILRRRAEGDGGEAGDEELPNPDDVEEMDIEVPGWEAKGQWILSLDLVADSVKMITYLAFFCILLAFYGLPIHIMRDLFMTARAVMKRTKALLRYRRALNDMNKIPDATEEDLARENTCIICREEMRAWDPANNPDAVERTRPKKLRCGHILHLGCLKSWLERQQVCPTCRRSVVVRERGQGGGRQGRDAIQLRLGLGAAAPQQGVAGQQPAVDANAAGPAGQQPGDENLGDNNAVRMQFFNLGPFRVGIGQAVLGLGQGLGQANNQAAPPADAPAQNGAAVPPAVNNNAAARARPGHAQAPSPSADQGQEAPSSGTQPPAQQGPATARLPRFVASRSSRTGTGRGAPGRPDSAAHIRDDLDDVLNRIRAEMDELTRLWGQGSALRYIASLLALYRQGQFANAAFRPPNSFRGAVDLPGFYPADPAVRHTLRPGPAIAAGSPELPEGVVLPEGWSLMPLRRVDQATPRIPSPAGPRMPTPSAGTAAGPTTGGAAPSQPATAEGGSGGPATDNSAGRPSSARVRRPAETIAAMNPSLSAGEFLDRYLDEMLPYSGESGPFSLSGVGHNPRGRATDPAFPFLRNSPTNGELALALLSEVELGQMVAVGDMPVAVATPAVYVPSIAARWRERLTDRDRAVIMEQNMTAANSLVDRLGHRLVLRLLQNHLHNAGHMLRAGPSGIVWDYVHWQAAQLSNPPAQPATSVQSTGPLPSARVPPTASEQAPAAAQAQNVDPSLEAMAQALQRALAAAGGPVVEEMLRGTLPAGLSALFGANGHVPHATQSQNSQPTSVPSQTPSGTADVSRDATSAGADIEPHRPETGRSVDANAATAPNSSNMPRWPGNSQIFTFSVPGTASGQGGSDGNGNSSGSGNGEAGPNFTSSTTETASSDSDEPSTRQKDTGKGKEPAHAAPMEDERKGKEPAHAATVEDAVEDLD